MDFGSVWAGLSYRSLDGASFRILMEPHLIKIITLPIIGVNVNNMLTLILRFGSL
jgi:hypothetical protein